jgi:hypothetical protein
MGPAVLLVLLLSGADPAPAKAPAASFKCTGERAKDKQTQELRKNTERTDLFKFAAAQLGAPKSCSVKWQRGEDADFAKLAYRFEKGTATFESLPPETDITTLEADGGFADAAAVRTYFKKIESVNQFKIDWTKKPEVTTEKGEQTETYSSPDEGTNAMVDFTSKGGKLIRVSFHYAL